MEMLEKLDFCGCRKHENNKCDYLDCAKYVCGAKHGNGSRNDRSGEFAKNAKAKVIIVIIGH